METWADIVTAEREILSHKDPEDWLRGWRLPTVIGLILVCAAGFITGYAVLW